MQGAARQRRRRAPAAEVVEAVEDGAVLAHVELDQLRLQNRGRIPLSESAPPSLHAELQGVSV